MPSPLAAVVLCAGKGTRMKSARAKVLHDLVGRPLCCPPLERAHELGASPVVVVVGHQAEEVERAVRAHLPGAPLAFALQERQLGTAHAVLAARRALKAYAGDLLILYGDVPLVRLATLKALKRAKRAAHAPLALVATRPPTPTGYGRIVRDAAGRIAGIVEERDASPDVRRLSEVNAGIYLVDATFLWRALARVGRRNAQRELYLTDLAALAARSGRPAAAIEAPFEEVAGVNDRAELACAARALRRRVNEAHMRRGVTLDDPNTTFIEESVVLATDARVGPFCVLAGATRVGAGASLGPGCVVRDSAIGAKAELKAYSVLEGASVGRGCLVGPFARLRPGTELGDRVHVGNFVETKKARIGRGSKANHLTYLGDCEIGRGVNVGAGTITCNYDGVDKHRTVLGDGVFVGSDTQFVAPLTVGRGAYIGAGSTIVKDVPPYALAVARGRQVVKPGWARRRSRR